MFEHCSERFARTDRSPCRGEMSWQRVTVHWSIQCVLETRVTVKLNNCLLWNTAHLQREQQWFICMSQRLLYSTWASCHESLSHLSYSEMNIRPRHSNLSEAISHFIMPLYEMINCHFKCTYGFEMRENTTKACRVNRKPVVCIHCGIQNDVVLHHIWWEEWVNLLLDTHARVHFWPWLHKTFRACNSKLRQ